MAPPQGQVSPSRYFAALVVLIAGLYALVFFTGPGDSWDEKITPRLGLDLVGGTTVTLIASTPDGQPPQPEQLEEARNIIENRVNGLGVAEPEVVTEGDRNIVVTLAGENNDQVKQIGDPAQLRFRKVLGTAQDTSTPDVKPSPSPSTSGTASPTPTGTPKATPSAAPKAGASASPAATPSPSKPADGKPSEAEVAKKFNVPAIVGVLQQVKDPAQLADPRLAPLFAPAKTLEPAELALLPAEWQMKFPTVSCEALNNRPAGSIDAVDKQVVACEGKTKYLLDKAKVLGTDVSGADFSFNPGGQGGGTPGWRVTLKFKSDGQDKWTALTREAKGQQVAVVLDNEVVSAPTINDVITGDAEITGSFTKDEAQALASKLRYGALPLTFEQGEANSISATLGTEQLRAGLLAAGIGMLLVAVYAFFYYRLLGSVIFLSLLLSAALVFAALILLGRSIGFTLTLAGIAGFIVALGIAADSFVIYFERLKDEIRDGRTARSAIPRAWVRARRTIISANAISILAAAVLYILAVGAVKGFAFALGMSTILDLVIVFLFRHPIMTLLARSKAFLSPRVSGLGRAMQQDTADDTPTTRPTRTKEA
ncbi:MAG TPA: protein translocase subunit SecD [Cryptosporangiaceae bacterium]|nr:protein translocase subunit SecD [Cryptosporangiaceae bacterium]